MHTHKILQNDKLSLLKNGINKLSKLWLNLPSKNFSVTISNENSKSSSLSLEVEQTDLGKKTLFFDFQSTTPMDPRVLDIMLPYMTVRFGNPHSKSHKYGWEAEKAVENAREVRAI